MGGRASSFGFVLVLNLGGQYGCGRPIIPHPVSPQKRVTPPQEHALIHSHFGGCSETTYVSSLLCSNTRRATYSTCQKSRPGFTWTGFALALWGITTALSPRISETWGPPHPRKSRAFLSSFEHLHCLVAGKLILGKEEHAHHTPYSPPMPVHCLLSKAVGNLEHDANAVASCPRHSTYVPDSPRCVSA